MFQSPFNPSLFDRLGPLAVPATSGFAAPYDVYRFEDRVEVHMDLPGVDPAGIDITVEGRDLTISGRREAPDVAEATVVSAGRRFGAFERRLHLGRALSDEGITADYSNGVLTLAVPVAEMAKPRKVLVGAGAPTAIDVSTD
jgi:HSP20 family protein